MSISRSIFSFNFLPNFPASKPSNKSQTGSLKSSSNFSVTKDQSLFLGRKSLLYLKNDGRIHKNDTSRRSFAVFSAVQPGVPPPSEPTFQILNWVLGVVVSMVIPFFTRRWGSLLKIRNEVETAVETIEEIVMVVEKVAEGVEKVSEDIAEHLPEGGNLRKAADFVESVAETVNKDAHLVGDFIDKVQEAEEKLEECVESLVEEAHEHREEVHGRHEHHDEIINNELLIEEAHEHRAELHGRHENHDEIINNEMLNAKL